VDQEQRCDAPENHLQCVICCQLYLIETCSDDLLEVHMPQKAISSYVLHQMLIQNQFLNSPYIAC
jgi:hypothetical protein